MALTFGSLFAIIPLLMLSFSMFKLFGGGEWFLDILRPVLLENLTPGSSEAMVQRIENLLHSSGQITTTGGIGLLFLVVTVWGIFSAVESTFNHIWGVESHAGKLRRLPHYWGLITIIPILVISSLAVTTYLKALPLVSRAVQGVTFAESVANRLLPILLVFLSFFLLYKFLPNTRVRRRAAVVGAVVAGLLYEAVKSGFIFYTGKVVKYDLFYGSLAVIALMIVWLNLSWIVTLLGVEMCFVIQHYRILKNKRKHIHFTRFQQDALAYHILIQVALSFRGVRQAVAADEWSHRYGIPPGIVSMVIEKLRSGGLLEHIEPRGSRLLLVRDPNCVTIDEIDRMLSGEDSEEWMWPPEWLMLKEWMKNRQEIKRPQDMTLGQLVTLLEGRYEILDAAFQRKIGGTS